MAESDALQSVWDVSELKTTSVTDCGQRSGRDPDGSETYPPNRVESSRLLLETDADIIYVSAVEGGRDESGVLLSLPHIYIYKLANLTDIPIIKAVKCCSRKQENSKCSESEPLEGVSMHCGV